MNFINKHCRALSLIALTGFGVIAPPTAMASDPDAVESLSNATIVNFLGGPKHGSMIQVQGVSSTGPVESRWVCLDPGAEHMTAQESERLFALALTFYSTGATVNTEFWPNRTATACGSYPVLFDLRLDL